MIYTELRLKGNSIIEGSVAGAPAETLYFDRGSGLLQRTEVTIQGMLLRTGYEDYRRIDGVLLPFITRRARPGFTWTYRVKEIVHNGSLADSFFEKPR